MCNHFNEFYWAQSLLCLLLLIFIFSLFYDDPAGLFSKQKKLQYDVFTGLSGLISACPLYGLTLLEAFLWHVWSSLLWGERERRDCVDGYVVYVWKLWGKYDLYGCNVIKHRFQKDQYLCIFITFTSFSFLMM